MHCACAAKDADIASVLKLLLEAGADKELRDSLGRRPLDLLLAQAGESQLNKPEYSGDAFRMYSFKVLDCSNDDAHDWTQCPFAHPGEKARRRDPRVFNYTGAACPDFRKGVCKRGDECTYGHGVFECWLHPSRYRTQLCKDGELCSRRICFFAHAPSEVRAAPTGGGEGEEGGCAPEGAAEGSKAPGGLCADKDKSDAASDVSGSPSLAGGAGILRSPSSFCSNSTDDRLDGKASPPARAAAPAPQAAAAAGTPDKPGGAEPSRAAQPRRAAGDSTCGSSGCGSPSRLRAPSALAKRGGLQAAASAPLLPAAKGCDRRPSSALLAAYAAASSTGGPSTDACALSDSAAAAAAAQAAAAAAQAAPVSAACLEAAHLAALTHADFGALSAMAGLDQTLSAAAAAAAALHGGLGASAPPLHAAAAGALLGGPLPCEPHCAANGLWGVAAHPFAPQVVPLSPAAAAASVPSYSGADAASWLLAHPHLLAAAHAEQAAAAAAAAALQRQQLVHGALFPIALAHVGGLHQEQALAVQQQLQLLANACLPLQHF